MNGTVRGTASVGWTDESPPPSFGPSSTTETGQSHNYNSQAVQLRGHAPQVDIRCRRSLMAEEHLLVGQARLLRLHQTNGKTERFIRTALKERAPIPLLREACKPFISAAICRFALTFQYQRTIPALIGKHRVGWLACRRDSGKFAALPLPTTAIQKQNTYQEKGMDPCSRHSPDADGPPRSSMTEGVFTSIPSP